MIKKNTVAVVALPASNNVAESNLDQIEDVAGDLTGALAVIKATAMLALYRIDRGTPNGAKAYAMIERTLATVDEAQTAAHCLADHAIELAHADLPPQ